MYKLQNGRTTRLTNKTTVTIDGKQVSNPTLLPKEILNSLGWYDIKIVYPQEWTDLLADYDETSEPLAVHVEQESLEIIDNEIVRTYVVVANEVEESVDPIIYREQMRDRLEEASKPESFEFECVVSGETLSFNISDSDRIDVLGQLAMSQETIEIHDIKRAKTSYTIVEASTVMATLAEITRAYKYPYDAKIKAMYELPDGFSIADIDAII